MVFTPESLIEQLFFSTVRILNPPSVGTGFLYLHQLVADRAITMLITNKHVVQGDTGTLVFHRAAGVTPDARAKPAGRVLKRQITGFKNLWVPHPSADIDLCGMLIGGIINTAEAEKKPLFWRSLDPSLIWPTDQLANLNAAEEVFMIGYPNGLWDESNNLPILRRGVTASHPVTVYERKAEMLVDIAVYPGSSGSPVLIAQDSYMDKKGNLNIKQRAVFLGVLYAGPVITNDGEIVIRNVPTAQVPIPRVQLMMNIGYIIKAREVRTLAEHIGALLLQGNAVSVPT